MIALVVKPGVFMEGEAYQLRMRAGKVMSHGTEQCVSAAEGMCGTAAYAEVSFDFNSPPFSSVSSVNSFTVIGDDGKSGTAMST